jgi:glycolate oxidase
MDNIIRIGAKYGLKITSVFHAGDGNVHPILLFDEADPEQVQRVMHASEEILQYCISIGGTITGEHGVGVEKLHLMPKMFNPATIRMFQRLKESFDPDHRINDAKLIPSDRMEVQLIKPMRVNNPGGAG